MGKLWNDITQMGVTSKMSASVEKIILEDEAVRGKSIGK